MKCVICKKDLSLEEINSYSFKDRNNKLELICKNCNKDSIRGNRFKLMKESKNITSKPLGIWIFPAIIFMLNLYYWYPVYTGNWESIDSIFEASLFSGFFWINIILTFIGIYAVTIGFHRAKNWARLYEIGYLSYSSFWALASMFVMRWQTIEHYIYLIIYLILISYLLMSPIKEYFKK